MSIIILEEERALRDALVAYLAKLGFPVRLATGDAAEFEQAVLADPPRFVLMELLLGDPFADPPEGLRLLERLSVAIPRTKVIVLTACLSAAHRARARNLGALACLEKHRLPAPTLAALLLPRLRELRSRDVPSPARSSAGAGSRR